MNPIGAIFSPFEKLENMPIQPKGALNTFGKVIINMEYVDGLQDLGGFSHVYLIYNFHRSDRTELNVTPFMDNQERGVFSTRSPLRPTKIGISITEIVSIDKNIITVKGIDILNATPLLDIKPYIPQFDYFKNVKTGWMQKSKEDVEETVSDGRFI